MAKRAKDQGDSGDLFGKPEKPEDEVDWTFKLHGKGEYRADARQSDPETSHEAAEKLEGEQVKVGRYEGQCLHGVRMNSGDTIREIVELFLKQDMPTYSPRFCKLRYKGLIWYGAKRPCRITGENCMTMWATEKEADLHPLLKVAKKRTRREYGKE